MRLKQLAFFSLVFTLAIGMGILGYVFGPSVNKYAIETPDPANAASVGSLLPGSISTVFGQPEMYKDFFGYPRVAVAPTGTVKSLVLPHHLVAGNYVAGVFQSLKNMKPSVVVVIGPNHYQVGNKFILSSKLNWDTTAGILSADSFLVDSLASSGLVGIDDSALTNEHSIGALAPFIKNTWPEAKVVPLIVKNIKNDELADGLASKLYEILPANSLVIASVDFSHYLTKNVANFHDDLSINVLSTGDINRVKKMEIDSQNSIRALLKYNNLVGATRFTLAFHTNSADILRQDNLPETTSHVLGFFSRETRSAEPAISLQLFGDMMLERNVEKSFGKDRLDYVFENLKGQENRFFYGVDLLVANLEGPFAPARIKTSKSIAFRFDPNLGKDLKKYGFSGFSLANNHTLDMGIKNYDFTKQVLVDNGLAYFGYQTKEGSDYMWAAGDKEQLPEKVVFIGLNNTDHPLNIAKVKESLQTAKKEARYVIVYMHWGNEYQRISSASQRELGHWLVDNGATAVIGMHPHVIQEMEIYNGRPIFYSLGNFVFDQYFSKDTQEGISVGLNLQNGQVKDIYVFPFYSVKSQNTLMSGVRQNEFFKWWNKNSRIGGKNFVDNKLTLN